MGLKTPTPGLRVFHNSNTAQKVEITVPAGAELTVPVEIAGQMNDASTHFEVDRDEYAKAKKEFDDQAAADASEASERAHREYHRLPEEDAAKPEKAKSVKKTAKKTSG